MGLYVSTTGTDVSIPELGFTLVHPTTNYALSDQFSIEDIQMASTLTTVIRAGTLTWKKTSGGSVQAATDYDPDLVEADALNLGVGAQADRLVSFKDMTLSTLKIKSGVIAAITFTGNPRTASVVFGTAFPTAGYSVTVTGGDGRSWLVSSISTTGFTISAQAAAALTAPVSWHAIYNGETA